LKTFEFKSQPVLRAVVEDAEYDEAVHKLKSEGVDYRIEVVNRRVYRRGVIDFQLTKAEAVLEELKEEKTELDSLKERDTFYKELRRQRKNNDVILGKMRGRKRRREE
jgi:hypothetical protein